MIDVYEDSNQTLTILQSTYDVHYQIETFSDIFYIYLVVLVECMCVCGFVDFKLANGELTGFSFHMQLMLKHSGAR